MKSQNFRIYKDTDGKPYRFNQEQFCEQLIQKKKINKDNHVRYTQLSIMEEIADKACVTVEAVKKWKQGDNGPGSIEAVKDCAEILNIEYLDLLIPLDNQEVTKMNKYDMELVNKIYGEMVSLVHYDKKLKSKFVVNEEPKERAAKRHDLKEKLAEKIEDIHELIDVSSLLVSENVRYKLHRILMEAYDYFVEDTWCIERWEALEENDTGNGIEVNVDFKNLTLYRQSIDRNTALANCGIEYLYDEINLAENLGYEDVPAIPDEIYENADVGGWGFHEDGTEFSMEEMEVLGFQGTEDCGTEINPLAVAVDLTVTVIKDVFRNDFPELGI